MKTIFRNNEQTSIFQLRIFSSSISSECISLNYFLFLISCDLVAFRKNAVFFGRLIAFDIHAAGITRNEGVWLHLIFMRLE